MGERCQTYQRSGIYKVFCDLADAVYSWSDLSMEERREKVVEEFNVLISKNNLASENWKAKKMTEIDVDLFSNLFLDKKQEKEGKHLLEEFKKAYKTIREDNLAAQESFFNLSLVYQYLDTFLSLCRFVFETGSIFQDEVRSLRIIETLLNIELDIDEGFVSFLSPFALFSILRTIEYIVKLPRENDNLPLDENKENDYLNSGIMQKLNRRKHILATYAIHAFSRFTIINGKSYVLNYSRRNSKIICKESEKCSSIENIKPIRLFEKIISHLTNKIEAATRNSNQQIDHIDLSVTVMGFASVVKKNSSIDIREITDLIYEIFSWFEDIKSKNDGKLLEKTQLRFTLQYVKTAKDENVNTILSEKYVYKSRNNETIGFCSLNIRENPSAKNNKAELEKNIGLSDIIFLLDCPWLAIEDFHAVNYGDIFTYINWLKEHSYKQDLYKDIRSDDSTRSAFSKDHLFYSLNEQLNRIAVDNFVKYGKIVRVPKNYLTNWIVDEMEKYRRHQVYKTVYLYTSSVSGMLLSDCVDYPIIREEVYNNKKFNIMRFSSRPNAVLSKHSDKPIEIELWSLLKYVDVSFVLIAIKEYFAENFNKFADISQNASEEERKQAIERDIISICRGIVFQIYPDNINPEGVSRIRIKLALDRPIKANLNEVINNQGTRDLLVFFNVIIRQVIFCNSKGFGDNCIRDAFESCLYSKAKSVNDLFLWYDYRLKRNEACLDAFVLDFDNSTIIPTEIGLRASTFDSFSDKRIYSRLLEYLSLASPPEHLIFSMLRKANGLYSSIDENNHSISMLKNIIDVSNFESEYKSRLTSNAQSILYNLR